MRALPGSPLLGIAIRDRAMNFRVEHLASSIKNLISSIELQHSVT
jgi:hypothetical protein